MLAWELVVEAQALRSQGCVNGGRKLTPFRRLKIDPLVFILRLTIPGLARGRGL